MKNLVKRVAITIGAAVLLTAGMLSSASAASIYPDVIFGSGNANGGFTVGTNNNIEVGLRAKQRFPKANIFKYDGVDTYQFSAGESSPGSGRPIWNFEWSVNTDVNGTSGAKVGDYTYRLKLDTDPGAGQTFTTFDPISTLGYFDHAFGDNNTGNGGGISTNDLVNDGFVRTVNYQTWLTTENVVQNSWSMHWFTLIDPTIAGLYRIEMEVLNQAGEMLSNSGINVQVSAVPLPAALPLYGAGIAVLGFMGWRRKRKTA